MKKYLAILALSGAMYLNAESVAVNAQTTAKVRDSATNIPKEIKIMRMVANAKIKAEYKPLDSNIKAALEKIYKEKDNKSFTFEKLQKANAKNKDVGLAMAAYIIGKSTLYMSQADSAKQIEMSKNFSKKDTMSKELKDKYVKEHPDEMRKLYFLIIKDMLDNGIPQMSKR